MKSVDYYMQIALEEARKTIDDELPIGCVIIDSIGNIITKSSNKTMQNQSPIAHAELLCIQEALQKTGAQYLTNCSIYVTLEPCPMCTFAITLARIKNLYFGTLSNKTGGVISNLNIINNRACHHKTNIYHGFLEKECNEILQSFFQEKRR